MAIYLLDGRLCPALFLDELGPNGEPQRAVYFYGSTEGAAAAEQRTTASLVNTALYQQWTPADYPHGAHLYTIVRDDANLQEVLNYLRAAYDHREACAAAAEAGATAGTGDVATDDAGDAVDTAPVDNRPAWQQQGFASKAEWKAAQK